MKRSVLLGILVAAIATAWVGCSWDTGSDAESWSDSYNWVNFSGAYRAPTGGILVTDYTTTPTIPGVTTTNGPVSQSYSFGADVTGVSENVTHPNIAPGSFSVTVGKPSAPLTFQDDGNGVLPKSGDFSGGVTYSSGSWYVKSDSGSGFPPGGSSDPVTATVTYKYIVSTDGSDGGSTTPGSTGKTIYSFNLAQQGQNLTLTDNNGAVYSGYIKTMRSASGSERTDETTKWMPQDGDSIIATFECSGTSSAGINVKITGTLQGTVSGGVFTGRTMTATWIEPSITGNINGVANSITISIPQSTTTDTTVTE